MEVGTLMGRKPVKLLYLSSVDVGLPNGPGVNEREFILAASQRFGKGFVAVVPRPVDNVPELSNCVIRYCRNHAGYGPVRFALFVIQQVLIASWVAWRVPCELVVVRLGPFPLAALCLQRLLKVPVAVKTMGRIEVTPAPVSLSPRRWFRYVSGKVQLAVLRGAIAVDVVTPLLLERALSLVGDRTPVRLIDNAVNTERFTPDRGARPTVLAGVEGGRPVLGFAGGSPSARGARQIVESLHGLRDDLPDAVALVVGFDAGLDELKRLAESYGVASRCVFAGVVPYSEVPRYVDAMDICFSFDLPSMGEIRGNASQKVRQYLAMGKPVISTNVGNEFLLKEDLGSLADPTDYEAVAKHVLRWWQQVQREGADFAERARDYAVVHLSTQAVMEKRVQFWREQLERVV